MARSACIAAATFLTRPLVFRLRPGSVGLSAGAIHREPRRPGSLRRFHAQCRRGREGRASGASVARVRRAHIRGVSDPSLLSADGRLRDLTLLLTDCLLFLVVFLSPLRANGWQKSKGGAYRDDIAIAVADLETDSP